MSRSNIEQSSVIEVSKVSKTEETNVDSTLDKDALLKQQQEEILALKSQLEQQKSSTGEIKEKVQNVPPMSLNNNVDASVQPILVSNNDNEMVLKSKLNSMEYEIAQLQSFLINQNKQ